jgi:hypothetical protein
MDIATANEVTLRKHARENLGINPPAGLTLAELRDYCREQDPASRPAPAPARHVPITEVGPVAKLPRDQTRVIRIHESSGPNNVDPVTVTINTYSYTLKRGVPIRVPLYVVKVLEQAVETRYEYDRDPGADPHGARLLHRNVPSYPFSIVDEPGVNDPVDGGAAA